MIEKICEFILKKIRKEMPEMDDEKAEVIRYGIQLIIGEMPKIFILFVPNSTTKLRYWMAEGPVGAFGASRPPDARLGHSLKLVYG